MYLRLSNTIFKRLRIPNLLRLYTRDTETCFVFIVRVTWPIPKLKNNKHVMRIKTEKRMFWMQNNSYSNITYRIEIPTLHSYEMYYLFYRKKNWIKIKKKNLPSSHLVLYLEVLLYPEVPGFRSHLTNKRSVIEASAWVPANNADVGWPTQRAADLTLGTPGHLPTPEPTCP